MRQLSRRDMLVIGAGGVVVTLVASQGPVFADTKEAAEEIAKFTGGKTPDKGKVSIELPEIAENGNTVPLTISVESPMSDDDYVSDVLIVADGNPRPGVAALKFTPMSGKAEAAIRIRLATTQNIIAIAKTSKGALLTEQKLVKVTIGGCGG